MSSIAGRPTLSISQRSMQDWTIGTYKKIRGRLEGKTFVESETSKTKLNI